MRFFFTYFNFFLISSCSSQMNIEKFKGSHSNIHLRHWFEGKDRSVGMFHDRFKKFKTEHLKSGDITFGTLESNILMLDEKFLYNDGEQDSRVWTIKILENKST